jgi:hypothetical protein
MGLGGSMHCLGMCGPLVMSLTKNSFENVLYQFGRLFGYVSLGLIIKIIGFGLINQKEKYVIISAGILIGCLYTIQGLSLLKLMKEIKFPFFRILSKLAQNKMQFNPSPGWAGFLSAFLPCGLLYTTIFSLLVLQNTEIAFLSLVSFWIGTLPMLLFSATLMKKMFQPFIQKLPKVAGTLLILIGVTTLFFRISPLIHNEQGKCTHCHQEKTLTSKK